MASRGWKAGLENKLALSEHFLEDEARREIHESLRTWEDVENYLILDLLNDEDLEDFYEEDLYEESHRDDLSYEDSFWDDSFYDLCID